MIFVLVIMLLLQTYTVTMDLGEVVLGVRPWNSVELLVDLGLLALFSTAIGFLDARRQRRAQEKKNGN